MINQNIHLCIAWLMEFSQAIVFDWKICIKDE